MAQTDTVVGRIAGAFGVRGELKCDPTNAGRTIFFAGAELRCVRGEESHPVRLAAVRPHKNRLLIRIEGVDDGTAAAAYAGALLCTARANIPLAENEYFDDDLVGCAVYGSDGDSYGTVDRVEHYPSSDMLVVGGRMIPMVRAIVTTIDLAQRRIVVD
ncbi:MAG TPA: ribosome maturation factor RimM, partial [Candidatus Nitrosotalea sp.]|nr:ribosome maturation factor RimM [Candidatus Nitrosotalea sp.]